MEIKNITQAIRDIPRKIKEYAQPRPETKGDLVSSSPAAAVIGGGLEGFIAGGPVLAASGAIGGYLGVKAGEKTQSFAKAVAAGSVAGTAISMITTAAIATAIGGPVGLTTMAAAGILGGFSGAVGTLSGSRRASTRDSVYGGTVTGMVAGVFTGNPAMMIATAAGAGIGGRAVKPAGRAVLGALSGAATGAISSVFGGPITMAIGASVGAVAGAVGATLGPAVRQMMRNATEDLSNKAFEKIQPVLQKHKLGKTGKTLLGGLAGAIAIAPIGLILGPISLGVAAAAGAIIGAASTFKALGAAEKEGRGQKGIASGA